MNLFHITSILYTINYQMTNGESRCVSNERAEEEVVITFSEGVMILMETKEIE